MVQTPWLPAFGLTPAETQVLASLFAGCRLNETAATLAVFASVAAKQRHRSVSAPALQTQGLLNAERLALMVAGAAFINVSPGSVVDEPALIDALRSGYSGEATLDVFATEPLPASSPLWEMDNVPSPRILPRSRCRHRRRRLARMCGDCGLGQPVLNRVDPGQGY